MSFLELRLPNLTEGEPEAQLRQLRSYLYQLTEQLQLALGSREKIAAAPDTRKLLTEAVALSAKRADGRYVNQEALEHPWRQQRQGLDELETRLALLEDAPALPERPPEALQGAQGPGIQIQAENTVRFHPLPPFVQTPEGHWQIL